MISSINSQHPVTTLHTAFFLSEHILPTVLSLSLSHTFPLYSALPPSLSPCLSLQVVWDGLSPCITDMPGSTPFTPLLPPIQEDGRRSNTVPPHTHTHTHTHPHTHTPLLM